MPDRRVFLETGGGAALWCALSPRLGAAAPARRRCLVVLLQRGANDGLNTVVPWGDKSYRSSRPSLAIDPPRRGRDDAAIDLDGFFGFHPALEPLLPLWQAGRLAAVHAVGSPDATRSHFDAQDYIESGTPGRKSTPDGWMNRALVAAGPGGTPFRGVALTPTLPRALAGDAAAVSVSDPDSFGLRRGAPASVIEGFEAMYGAQGTDSVTQAGKEALEAKDFLRERLRRSRGPERSASYPRDPDGSALRDVARLIHADVGMEVAFTEMGGWDHHAGQGGTRGQHANRLRTLGQAIAAFDLDLGERRDDVVLVVLTEFGRTVRENGNRGTDHGHGSVALVVGGRVRGGRVLGRWPGLKREQLHEGRDLAITTDFRDLLAEALQEQLGVTDLKAVFPGHEPSARPGAIGT